MSSTNSVDSELDKAMEKLLEQESQEAAKPLNPNDPKDVAKLTDAARKDAAQDLQQLTDADYNKMEVAAERNRVGGQVMTPQGLNDKNLNDRLDALDKQLDAAGTAKLQVMDNVTARVEDTVARFLPEKDNKLTQKIAEGLMQESEERATNRETVTELGREVAGAIPDSVKNLAMNAVQGIKNMGVSLAQMTENTVPDQARSTSQSTQSPER